MRPHMHDQCYVEEPRTTTTMTDRSLSRAVCDIEHVTRRKPTVLDPVQVSLTLLLYMIVNLITQL